MKSTTEMRKVARRFPGGLVMLAVLVLPLVSCTAPAAAQAPSIITYYFAGTLNEPFGTLPTGTPFCGSFSYDGSQPTNTPWVPYRGDYHYTSVAVTVDGVIVTDDGTGVINVYDHGAGYPPDPVGDTSGYPTDLFHLYTFAVSGAFGGLTLTPGAGIQIVLQDVTGTVFSDPSILRPDVSVSDFTTGNATFLQLQAEAMIPPFPFPQLVFARGELTALSTSPVQCAGTIQVIIDIKPGSFPNSINPRNRAVVPLAILTTDTFDAITVDPTTVRFGATGTEAAPVHSALKDVDGDGDTDMILHFKTQDTGIICGEASASLTGETLGGQVIEGSDSIKTAGCKMVACK